MNNITVNMDNLSADERDQLVKLISKANKEPEPGYWVPEKGDIYYSICGTKCVNGYRYNNDEYDHEKMDGFNFFKTKEEAELYERKLQIINHMAKIASIDPADATDNNEKKWCLYYSANSDSVYAKRYMAIVSPIAFKTEELAQRVIREIGEENLKKYYFGVKD